MFHGILRSYLFNQAHLEFPWVIKSPTRFPLNEIDMCNHDMCKTIITINPSVVENGNLRVNIIVANKDEYSTDHQIHVKLE